MKDLDLEALRFTLRAQERVVSGAGTQKRVFEHTIYEHVYTPLTKRSYRRGESVDVTENLTVPLDALYTFKAEDNEVRWSVEVLVDIKGVLDWQREAALTVAPWREGMIEPLRVAN